MSELKKLHQMKQNLIKIVIDQVKKQLEHNEKTEQKDVFVGLEAFYVHTTDENALEALALDTSC